MRPDFFKGTFSDFDDEFDTLKFRGAVLLDGNTLNVSEDDLVDYINATILFWNEMPERAYADVDKVLEALNN